MFKNGCMNVVLKVFCIKWFGPSDYLPGTIASWAWIWAIIRMDLSFSSNSAWPPHLSHSSVLWPDLASFPSSASRLTGPLNKVPQCLLPVLQPGLTPPDHATFLCWESRGRCSGLRTESEMGSSEAVLPHLWRRRNKSWRGEQFVGRVRWKQFQYGQGLRIHSRNCCQRRYMAQVAATRHSVLGEVYHVPYLPFLQ